MELVVIKSKFQVLLVPCVPNYGDLRYQTQYLSNVSINSTPNHFITVL